MAQHVDLAREQKVPPAVSRPTIPENVVNYEIDNVLGQQATQRETRRHV